MKKGGIGERDKDNPLKSKKKGSELTGLKGTAVMQT